MFAALREAAGSSTLVVPAGPLPALLDEVHRAAADPAAVARVLQVTAVLVDGRSVARDSDVAVPDGAEVALLPPVSGGSG